MNHTSQIYVYWISCYVSNSFYTTKYWVHIFMLIYWTFMRARKNTGQRIQESNDTYNYCSPNHIVWSLQGDAGVICIMMNNPNFISFYITKVTNVSINNKKRKEIQIFYVQGMQLFYSCRMELRLVCILSFWIYRNFMYLNITKVTSVLIKRK